MSDPGEPKGSAELSSSPSTPRGMESSIAALASDQQLVRRYVETRAEDAFRDLYRAHSPYLFCLAMRVSGGRREEAEEALQEAWIRAAKKMPEFRWQSALKTWLGGFVINCCREQRRRRRPDGPEPTLVETSAPAPDGRLDLDRLLASLPEHQRTVLILFAIEGYTHQEIGGILGIAPGTSKSRLFEARRGLRGLRAEHRNSGDPE